MSQTAWGESDIGRNNDQPKVGEQHGLTELILEKVDFVSLVDNPAVPGAKFLVTKNMDSDIEDFNEETPTEEATEEGEESSDTVDSIRKTIAAEFSDSWVAEANTGGTAPDTTEYREQKKREARAIDSETVEKQYPAMNEDFAKQALDSRDSDSVEKETANEPVRKGYAGDPINPSVYTGDGGHSGTSESFAVDALNAAKSERDQ